MGALELSGHELSGLPRGKETRISCKQLGGFLSALDVLRGHSPCDSWGFPGALELGGAGMSDSGEASSCSGQEEMVRIFTPTKFLGQSRSRRGADPQTRREESQVQMTSKGCAGDIEGRGEAKESGLKGEAG